MSPNHILFLFCGPLVHTHIAGHEYPVKLLFGKSSASGNDPLQQSTP